MMIPNYYMLMNETNSLFYIILIIKLQFNSLNSPLQNSISRFSDPKSSNQNHNITLVNKTSKSIIL